MCRACVPGMPRLTTVELAAACAEDSSRQTQQACLQSVPIDKAKLQLADDHAARPVASPGQAVLEVARRTGLSSQLDFSDQHDNAALPLHDLQVLVAVAAAAPAAEIRQTEGMLKAAAGQSRRENAAQLGLRRASAHG